MATIKDYKFADGHVEDVECTEEFKRKYEKMLKKQKYSNWRERQLQPLYIDGVNVEEEDIADPVNRSPEEIFIEQEKEAAIFNWEETQSELLFEGLTEYQSRVAFKYYTERKSQSEIAKEEGVNKGSICKIIKKIQKKICSNLCNDSSL